MPVAHSRNQIVYATHYDQVRSEHGFKWGARVEQPSQEKTPEKANSTRNSRSTRGTTASYLKHFSSFRLDGIEYQVGDFILTGESSARGEQFVGRIASAYEDETRSCKVSIEWLSRWKDLPGPIQKKLPKSKLDEPWELIACPEKGVHNQLHILNGKCQIMSHQQFKATYNGKPPKNLVQKVFFVRYAYDFSSRQVFELQFEDFLQGSDHLQELYLGRKLAQPTKLVKQPLVDMKAALDSDSDEGEISDFSEEDSDVSDSDDSDLIEADDAVVYESASDQSDQEMEPKQPSPKRSVRQAFPTRKKIMAKKIKMSTLASTTSKRKHHRKEAQTEYELAREHLHVSSIPEMLPCREEEFAEITGYLEDAIAEGSGCCIYISGTPGTGKTATVTHVIRSLRQRVEEDDMKSFSYCEINGMKLTDPQQAYVLLWQHLTGERVSASHAAELLDRRFSNPSPRVEPIVVLMDELDQMVTRKQDVMYNFFDWPNRPHSHLIVVAVANTMDLPERTLANRIVSRMGLTRMNFLTYTHEQITEIVQSRLEGTNVFERSAMEFAARKVASIQGDARRALDICRRAVEIAEEESKSTGEKTLVKIQHIQRAVQEMDQSPVQVTLARASLQQKLLLIALFNRVRKSGVLEVVYREVIEEHINLCKIHDFPIPNSSEFSIILAGLGSNRVLSVQDSRLDIWRKVRLQIEQEEVLAAFRNDVTVRKCLPVQ